MKRLCPNGHDTAVCGRTKGRCRSCSKNRLTRWKKAHPQRWAEHQRRYVQSHPEVGRAKSRRWQLKHPEEKATMKRRYRATHARTADRNWSLKKLYGLTPEAYASMLASQCGHCAICERTSSGKRHLSVDHDHATGQVRGLLCAGCNLLVGFLEHERREAAGAYLERHR